MGLWKHAYTTSKPEIAELAKRGAKLMFQHQVSSVVEKHTIPHEYYALIMNFEQTPG